VKGARALASGMLVLAAICAVPAVSAAQDAGTTTTATTTTTTTTATTPAGPAQPVAPAGQTPPTPPSGGPGAGTPTEPRDESGTTSPPIGDRSPATGPPGSGGAARKSASASVTIVDFAFSPATVTVSVGDTVTWRNTGQAPHNATASDGSFKTPDLNNGQSASHTFNSAGTFSYICTIHPNMHGTIRVLSSSGGGGGGSAGSTSSGSSSSESAAVASPNAAGNSTTLPMTGLAVGSLGLVGLALLGMGLVARRLRFMGGDAMANRDDPRAR